MKALLLLRRILKRKKPKFVKQDAHKKAKLSDSWRKPRGLQSKVRLEKKGYRSSISVGWKSPVKVRGLTREGYEPIKVNNVADLKKINPKTQAAEISATVGLKKKLGILEQSEKLGIHIKNIKNVKKFQEDSAKAISQKQQTKTTKLAAAKKKKEASKKKTTKKDERSEEQKKTDAKSEKDKVLNKKN